jgi:hypothetical protein
VNNQNDNVIMGNKMGQETEQNDEDFIHNLFDQEPNNTMHEQNLNEQTTERELRRSSREKKTVQKYDLNK